VAGVEMKLVSVTFLSPDMDYGEFVGRCGPRLRSVCPLVTVYGDEHDGALDASVFVNSMWFRAFPEDAAPGLKEESCDALAASSPPGTYHQQMLCLQRLSVLHACTPMTSVSMPLQSSVY
jgi:hypothetical protein